MNDMRNHDWISGVLEDLEIYCEDHKLDETKPLLRLAKRVFEAEKSAEFPSELTILDHLIRANQPPN